MSEITAKRFPVFLVCCLAKQGQYATFFPEIRNHVIAAGNEVNTILCDFELAAINSALATFPNGDISGCFFHLCSNVWKKIESLGPQAQCNNDQDFLFTDE